jgi:hypothetical protein
MNLQMLQKSLINEICRCCKNHRSETALEMLQAFIRQSANEAKTYRSLARILQASRADLSLAF